VGAGAPGQRDRVGDQAAVAAARAHGDDPLLLAGVLVVHGQAAQPVLDPGRDPCGADVVVRVHARDQPERRGGRDPPDPGDDHLALGHRAQQRVEGVLGDAVELLQVQEGVDRAGQDRVDRHAVRRQLDRHGLGQPDQAVLGRDVVRVVRHGALPGGRGDVDDPPRRSGHEQRREVLGDQPRALEVGVQDGVPGGLVQLPERRAGRDRRVVHQDVQAPEGLVHGRRGAPHGGPVAHVGDQGQRAAVEVLDAGDHLVELRPCGQAVARDGLVAADVQRRDVGAARASARQCSRPCPRAAPVTSATLPVSSAIQPLARERLELRERLDYARDSTGGSSPTIHLLIVRWTIPGWGSACRGNQLLTVGQACRYVGVSRMTLLAAEEAGLVRPTRTPGGHRRYTPRDLDRLLVRPDAVPGDAPRSSPPGPDHADPVVAEALRQLVLLLRAVAAALYDAQGGALALRRSYGLPRWLTDQLVDRPAPEPVVQALAGREARFDAADCFPRPSAGAGIAVPLARDGRAVGVLAVLAGRDRTFLGGELDIVRATATCLALMLEQQRLVDTLSARLREVHRLSTTAHC